LLKVSPEKHKRNLVLNLIGLSPHYFIYQWSDRYPVAMPYRKKLEAEHQRNILSREKICQQILLPYLQPHMVILDFGCGPGYLTREVAKHAKKVIGVDISSGIIACANKLNGADNIVYNVNNGRDISMVNSSCIDLVYTFAVLQHLSEELFQMILKEFFRVLKPHGKLIAHIAVAGKAGAQADPKENQFIFRYIKKRVTFDMLIRPLDDVSQKIMSLGFKKVAIIPIQQISDVEDDIVGQHLFVFEKI